jgi:tryptophan-rich sensory protein
MISGTLWNLLNWLLVGFSAWLLSTVAIGDLVKVYWIPRTMLITRWMTTPRSMQWVWLVVFLSTALSAWLVWKEHTGGWASSPIKLSFYLLLTLCSVLWFVVLYVSMSLRGAILMAILNVALAILLSILFYAANGTAGILCSLAVLWYLYIAAWSYYLRQTNCKKTYCVDPEFTFDFQPDPVGLPHPQVWEDAGRICPYKPVFQKFQKLPLPTASAAAAAGANPGTAPQDVGQFSSPYAVSAYNPAVTGYGDRYARSAASIPAPTAAGATFHNSPSASFSGPPSSSSSDEVMYTSSPSIKYNNYQHTPPNSAAAAAAATLPSLATSSQHRFSSSNWGSAPVPT